MGCASAVRFLTYCKCRPPVTMALRPPSPVLKSPPLSPATSPSDAGSPRAPNWLRIGLLFLASSACALSFAPPSPTAKETAQGYRDGRVLAKPKPEMAATIDKAERAE